MLERTQAATVGVLCVLLAGAPSALGGQEAGGTPVSALEGSWIWVERESDSIDRAIERGVADLGFVIRPVARRRLRSTTQPYRRIRLDLAHGDVATEYDGREPIRSPADGSVTRWQREDGEMLELATTLRDGVLVQTFTATDGSRENAFSPSTDGERLTLRVTIRSDRLPDPIVYRLVYRRGG